MAIILDGNRRYAKKLRLDPAKGHEHGAKKVEKLLDWTRELGVNELTLYVFSLENFQRAKREFKYLMGLLRQQCRKLMKDPWLEREGIRINFIGRLHMFPKDIQKTINNIMEKTKNYNSYTVNFAMGYSGRAEIADAAKKIAELVQSRSLDPEDVNEEAIRKHLYLSSYPDIIIRTGGEIRISNFLIYQGAYSEWFFLDKLWPEFTKEDLKQCLNEFSRRDRRFGK